MRSERTASGDTDEDEALRQWRAARDALDRALDDFQAKRGSTRELFVRVAALRRSEEVAWAALHEAVGLDPHRGV